MSSYGQLQVFADIQEWVGIKTATVIDRIK